MKGVFLLFSALYGLLQWHLQECLDVGTLNTTFAISVLGLVMMK